MNERSLFEDTKPRLVSHFTYINGNIGYSKQLLRIGDWVTVMGEPSCYQITRILSDGFLFATYYYKYHINTQMTTWLHLFAVQV